MLYLVEAYIPRAPPLKIAVRIVTILVLLPYLFDAFGVYRL